jgi:hypothetical protein
MDKQNGHRPACERRYLTRTEVTQEYPFFSMRTLVRLAKKGEGPPFSKIGGITIYDREDIEASIASNKVFPQPAEPSSGARPSRTAPAPAPPRKQQTKKRGPGRPAKPALPEPRRKPKGNAP